MIPPGMEDIFGSWREDMGGIDPASIRCLIVAASEHNTYALGLVAQNDTEDQYVRVGMMAWRTHPSKLGWNSSAQSWNEGGWKTITIL
jgi:hypothetical protein